MATMALPISELEPICIESQKVQAETECVVVCSTKERPDKGTFWAIVLKTIILRYRFSRLTGKQAKLLEDLVDRDFSRSTPADLEKLALRIDGLTSDEREILDLTKKLGAEIRACWNTSLNTLTDQVEYLESISMSLHAAADPEVSLLMGFVAERL
jgi:hypothetical protein